MRQTGFAEQAGDNTGRDENPDQEALELAEHNPKRADGFAFLQFVRAAGRKALRRFLRREPNRRGLKPAQHILSRLAVPSCVRRLCGEPLAICGQKAVSRWVCTNRIVHAFPFGCCFDDRCIRFSINLSNG